MWLVLPIYGILAGGLVFGFTFAANYAWVNHEGDTAKFPPIELAANIVSGSLNAALALSLAGILLSLVGGALFYFLKTKKKQSENLPANGLTTERHKTIAGSMVYTTGKIISLVSIGMIILAALVFFIGINIEGWFESEFLYTLIIAFVTGLWTVIPGILLIQALSRK